MAVLDSSEKEVGIVEKDRLLSPLGLANRDTKEWTRRSTAIG
jgi:hypothetical protein